MTTLLTFFAITGWVFAVILIRRTDRILSLVRKTSQLALLCEQNLDDRDSTIAELESKLIQYERGND